MAFVAGKKKGRRFGAAYAAGSWEPDEYAFEAEPYELNASSITPRAKAPASTLLDKVLPIKVNSAGKARIYGLPPVIAYSLAALFVGSALFSAGKGR